MFVMQYYFYRRVGTIYEQYIQCSGGGNAAVLLVLDKCVVPQHSALEIGGEGSSSWKIPRDLGRL